MMRRKAGREIEGRREGERNKNSFSRQQIIGFTCMRDRLPPPVTLIIFDLYHNLGSDFDVFSANLMIWSNFWFSVTKLAHLWIWATLKRLHWHWVSQSSSGHFVYLPSHFHFPGLTSDVSVGFIFGCRHCQMSGPNCYCGRIFALHNHTTQSVTCVGMLPAHTNLRSFPWPQWISDLVALWQSINIGALKDILTTCQHYWSDM